MLRVRFIGSVCRNMVNEIEYMVKGIRLFRNRLPDSHQSAPIMAKKDAGQPLVGGESVKATKKEKREKVMRSSLKF